MEKRRRFGKHVISSNVTFVSNADYGSSTLIKVKLLKHYFKHKKEEKKKAEEPRVRCGIDATRIDYVKIPPRYKTVCWKKREKTCKVVYELGERRGITTAKDKLQLALRLWSHLFDTRCSTYTDTK